MPHDFRLPSAAPSPGFTTMPGEPPESQSRLAARRAVEDELAQVSLQSAFFFEQAQPDLFGGDGDRVMCGEARVHRFVDDPAGVRG
jgi:hypothetical protein